MRSAPLLECKSLGFERDDLPLFAGLDFSLQPGSLLQVTGANGCGKTTLLKILTTSLRPSAGTLSWRGNLVDCDRHRYQAELLYIGHRSGLKLSLTPQQNLRWLQMVAGSGARLQAGQIDSALVTAGLAGFEDVRCDTLSAGQLRRVALARLLLGGALLWILDEPFTSLDKGAAAQLQQWLQAHLLQGGCVVLTSHQDLSMTNIQTLELERYAVSSV